MPEHYRPPLNAAKLKARDDAIPREWRLEASVLESADLVDVRSVPRTCGLLSAREIEITEVRGRDQDWLLKLQTPAAELVKRMAAGDLTSVEVTTAFSKRAAVAQQLTNCLTEILCVWKDYTA